MRDKALYTVCLLAILFVFGSCHMHNVSGTPYNVWHVGKRTHRHFGAPRGTTGRDRFWSNHRYGHRAFKFRGRYRDYQ